MSASEFILWIYF